MGEFLFPFALYAGITVAVFAIGILVRFVRHRISESWTSVPGAIENTDVEFEERGKLVVAVAKVSYSYRYQGEYYAGYYIRGFAREEAAEQFLTAFPRGTCVVIRCKPSDPDKSILREGDNAALNFPAAMRS
jgi:hypothetical protein